MRLAVLLLLLALLTGIIGFIYIEEYTLLEAFYMTIITISTVGFQEVRPLSPDGQLFSSILILLNILVLSYTLSAFSYYVVEGQVFKRIYIKRMEKEIKKMEDHVIVCGYGKYGKEIISHLYKHGMEALIIEKDEDAVKQLQADDRKLKHIHADATQDETLEFAGIGRAQAIIAALPDDSDNLFIVLSARQLNREIVIISRSKDTRSENKLELAGANHVILPEQIGGFYMATLVSKPSATEFFAFISDELEHDIGFAEMSYNTVPDEYKNRSIKELKIRKATGANIIGFKTADGRYKVNPAPDSVLEPNTSFILVGNTDQLQKLQEMMKFDLDL
jgi:voltage-gated potassium channel